MFVLFKFCDATNRFHISRMLCPLLYCCCVDDLDLEPFDSLASSPTVASIDNVGIDIYSTDLNFDDFEVQEDGETLRSLHFTPTPLFLENLNSNESAEK